MKYYAQCVAGLQDVATTLLQESRLAPTRVLLKEEGLIVLESATLPRDVGPLPFLNNCFLVLGESFEGDADTEGMLRQLTHDRSWRALAEASITPKERTFRIVLSDSSRLVGADRKAMGTAVAVIAEGTGLRHDPRRGDSEFWIIRRKSGRVFFCKRITRRARTERDLQPGELRPELAHLLCALSEPAVTDIFLDPFAGTGALPLARTSTPFNMIYMLDADPKKVAFLREMIKRGRGRRKGPPVIAGVADARHLERFEAGFIHKIVTDPPWGFFDAEIGDVTSFYHNVLTELCRVTKKGGILVMLVGRKDAADEMSREFLPQLQPVARHDILVAGKKAIVMKWLRK